MDVNETIVTGRVFRKLIDEANKLWMRISFWTKACDVEFEDGKNLEEKLNGYSIKVISEAEYQSLVEQGTTDPMTLYFRPKA